MGGPVVRGMAAYRASTRTASLSIPTFQLPSPLTTVVIPTLLVIFYLCPHIPLELQVHVPYSVFFIPQFTRLITTLFGSLRVARIVFYSSIGAHILEALYTGVRLKRTFGSFCGFEGLKWILSVLFLGVGNLIPLLNKLKDMERRYN